MTAGMSLPGGGMAKPADSGHISARIAWALRFAKVRPSWHTERAPTARIECAPLARMGLALVRLCEARYKYASFLEFTIIQCLSDLACLPNGFSGRGGDSPQAINPQK